MYSQSNLIFRDRFIKTTNGIKSKPPIVKIKILQETQKTTHKKNKDVSWEMNITLHLVIIKQINLVNLRNNITFSN